MIFGLTEDASGTGELSRHGELLHRVAYRIRRFQGTLGEGGLPVPGLYRVEGELTFDNAGTPPEVTGTPLTLRLEDGRSMEITITPDGRFLTEGRHPRGCSCC